jgi:phosphoenolpyruvate carboxylase
VCGGWAAAGRGGGPSYAALPMTPATSI